jgi:hypothetical protein
MPALDEVALRGQPVGAWPTNREARAIRPVDTWTAGHDGVPPTPVLEASASGMDPENGAGALSAESPLAALQARTGADRRPS